MQALRLRYARCWLPLVRHLRGASCNSYAGMMQRQCITQGQLRPAGRQQGSRLMDQIAVVVLESEGSLDVIRAPVDGPAHGTGTRAGSLRRCPAPLDALDRPFLRLQ